MKFVVLPIISAIFKIIATVVVMLIMLVIYTGYAIWNFRLKWTRFAIEFIENKEYKPSHQYQLTLKHKNIIKTTASVFNAWTGIINDL